MEKGKIGFSTATSLVIANMIGTGVFTSLGFQVLDIKSGFAILFLWFIGGIISLCGALVYGEIGSAFPRSGGEYNYLSQLYHPVAGFLSGWVSATVGFAAPVALAAMALGKYSAKVFPDINPTLLAISVVAVLTLIHSVNLKLGSAFQRLFTYAKVIVIALFLLAGAFYIPEHDMSFMPGTASIKEIFSAPFAVCLIYVSYAYSGWNAASYIAGELDNPQRTLPRSLFIGTFVVMIIYVLLNFIFLYSVPINELGGVLEVGYLSANKIFGLRIGNFMGLVISFLLVSSISAMIMAGPRIINAMGEDMHMLRFFAKKNKNNIPYVAIVVQSLITLLLILTSKFESVLTFVGFILNLFTFFTVFGIFIIRKNKLGMEGKYKTWGYPFTPIIFLTLNAWMLFFVMKNNTAESLIGFLLLAIGFLIYYVGKKYETGKSVE